MIEQTPIVATDYTTATAKRECPESVRTKRRIHVLPDDLLTLEEAAEWLRVSKEKLSAMTKGRNPKIIGYWLNQRVVRFHPRAVLAHMARNNGAGNELISAMFGDIHNHNTPLNHE